MANWNPRANEIFLDALGIDGLEDRRRFLDEACGPDETLRAAVEALRQAHDAAGSLLERPVLAVGLTVSQPSGPSGENPDHAGARIGPYKLLEPIGEGGMGTVWMAEQTEPLKRLVALKLIKTGLDSTQVLARFEAERQALALMDHPNIAKVLDAGTTPDGRPYFVMELVKGISITKFCDERRLSPRDRLALFIPVCHAVQHAHQKGIIHRDLKPSNILIALYDGKPVPKVIDFGIAKATGEKLTDRTLHTGFGALVGTLEYMSPEQAELNQLDVDTRSDIYSLGVLLYELLTGSTPLGRDRIKEKALLEVLLMIHEEEPPPPSTRLSNAQTLATLCEQRQMEPARIAKLMRGELDWIVMKALEKDRGRRYETVNSLAQDIDRYLKDEPVEAGPPSPTYRMRKFIKRNKGPVLAASLLLLALLGGILGTTLGMVRARQAEAVAEDERKVAENHKDSALKNAAEADQRKRQAEESAAEARNQKTRAEEKEKLALASEQAAIRQTEKTETTQLAFQLTQALRAWEKHDLKEAERIMDLVTPEGRQSWEYRHLRDNFRRMALPLPGAKIPISDRPEQYPIALSPDGTTLASVGFDDKQKNATVVRLWNVATGEPRINPMVVKGHPISGLAFNSDGKRLVACAVISTGKAPGQVNILVWDVASGVQTLAFQVADQWTGHMSVIFSPDDKLLVPAGRIDKVAGGITAWDSQTGKAITLGPADIEGMDASACLSPNGKLLLTSVQEGQPSQETKRVFKLWDLATGKVTATFEARPFAYEMSFSADGTRIAVSQRFGTHVWDTVSKSEVLRIDFGGKPALSPDGQTLAIGKNSVYTADRLLAVWDLPSRAMRKLCEWPELIVDALHFTERGQLAAAYHDHNARQGIRVRLLDLNAKLGPTHTFTVRDPKDSFTSTALAISPDGTRIAGGDRSKDSVTVWDVATRKPVCHFKTGATSNAGVGSAINASLAFSHDGKYLLCNSTNGLKWWDAASGKAVPGLHVPNTLPYSEALMVSRDGTRVAVPGRGEAWVLDAATARKVATLKLGRDTARLAISPHGKHLAVDSGTINVWDIETRKMVLTLPRYSYYLGQVAFSPDGRLLATLGADGNPDESQGSIRIWDAATGELKQTVKGNRPHSNPSCMAFSPDGKRIAYGFAEVFLQPARVHLQLKISDIATGVETLSIKVDHDGTIMNVDFSGDGKRLITTDNNGDIKLWEAP